MLNITSTIDEIDALIKNMEYLAPQHNERVRIKKIDDLVNLMQNKPLLELIRDTAGKDWEEDTNKLIKKIQNKYKIQQFTDIYINSLRCLLIYKALNDVTSTSSLELTREFGQWVFNARYQGENHVVKWFDIKVTRYFSKTDLPKKFMDLMRNESTYKIDKEWVLNNQDFFFNENIFKGYDVLLKEFMEKLAREEQTPELDIAQNIPQENEEEYGIPTVESKKENIQENKTVSAIAQVTESFKKKMVQVGVDIAGDPIMVEVDEQSLQNKDDEKTVENTEVKKEATIQIIIEEDRGITVSQPVEKVNEAKLNEVASSLAREPLPWEEDWEDEQISNKIKEKLDLPKPERLPQKIEIEKSVEQEKVVCSPEKPSVFSKPGSSFSKPGSSFMKPGSSFISSAMDDDPMLDAKESTENDDLDMQKERLTSSQENLQSLEMAEATLIETEDFDEVLQKNKEIEEVYKEEKIEILPKKRLFENGMTNNAEREAELDKQKKEEIARLNDLIKTKEEEDRKRIEEKGLNQNKAFLSLRKPAQETTPE